MKDIIVIDNVIGQEYQNIVEHDVVNLPWFYNRDIALDYASEQENPTIGFAHMLFNNGRSMSEKFQFLFPILLQGCSQSNRQFTNLLRAGAFMHVPNQPHNKYDGVHVNLDNPHWVGLYYVNDSDGDTVFFNETTMNYGSMDRVERTYTELTRVSPKKGRMVLFDGARYHSSTSPTSKIRCILTFDFI